MRPPGRRGPRRSQREKIDRRLRERLFREVALLWTTRLNRPDRITVADEVMNALEIVRRAMLPAMAELYEGWSDALERDDLPPFLTLGSSPSTSARWRGCATTSACPPRWWR